MKETSRNMALVGQKRHWLNQQCHCCQRAELKTVFASPGSCRELCTHLGSSQSSSRRIFLHYVYYCWPLHCPGMIMSPAESDCTLLFIDCTIKGSANQKKKNQACGRPVWCCVFLMMISRHMPGGLHCVSLYVLAGCGKDVVQQVGSVSSQHAAVHSEYLYVTYTVLTDR